VKRLVPALGIAGALAVSLFGCSFDSGVPGTAAGPAKIGAPGPASEFLEPPELVSSHGVVTFALASVINSTTNLPNFIYRGSLQAPTIRVWPGDHIVVELDDELPFGQGLGSDMNLHFHGLDTSPRRPADDTLTMLATPDHALYYDVPIRPSQPPGLYWYHPHVHGFTNYQVGEGGMSGAIVVEGINAHDPALAKMPERILIVRQLGSAGGEVVTRHNDGGPKGEVEPMGAMASMGPMHMTPGSPPVQNKPCVAEPAGVFLSVNNQVQPTIRFQPGQPQFFRVLNATGHRHVDLSLGGIPMHIVAMDGYPIDTYPGPSSLTQTHIVVPPAGRVEFVATLTAPTDLRSLCFFSGPVGDADPAAILAHLRVGPTGAVVNRAPGAALPTLRAAAQLALLAPRSALPPPVTTRTVRFSENNAGFYINGKAFSPTAPPVFVVRIGTVERWNILNTTLESHDFHLHQVHFLVESENGVALAHPLWRDTVRVPWRTKQPDGSWKDGSITILADFRDPLIRGTFLFHCHILDHEDQGMMAKIQAI
jgi:suppressor of ftsI